jgi:hypothetical protein
MTETPTNPSDADAGTLAVESAPATIAPAPPASRHNSLAIIPDTIPAVSELAEYIADSGMAPASYNDKDSRKPDKSKIIVGILHGMEIGLTPMAALQSIAVVGGMPTIWGDGAMALIQSSGLLVEKQEYREYDDKGEPVVAVCRMLRRGQEGWIEQTFSRAQAEKAGLTKKQGPWQQYFERMLQMRARLFCIRDGFADVLRGIPIAEEMRDTLDLAQEADGTYSAAPPRPTRADFTEDSADTAEAEAAGEEMDGQFNATLGDPPAAEDSAPPVPVAHLRDNPTKQEVQEWRNAMFDAIGAAVSRQAINEILEKHKASIDYLKMHYETDAQNLGDTIKERREDLSE